MDKITENESIEDKDILSMLGLEGRVGELKIIDAPSGFSASTKSAIFLRDSLNASLKCPICNGYLDANKAASYDHVVRKEDGGNGRSDNGQLTHPYCNSAIKN